MKLQHALDAIITITGPNIGVQRICSALTNRVYRLNSANKSWSLRINNSAEQSLGLNRATEQQILRRIRKQPWAVQVEFENAHILLCQWVDGQPLEGSEDQLSGIIQLMQQVQKVTFDPQNTIRTLNIAEQIQHFLAQQAQLPERFTRLARALCEQYEMTDSPVLCHHDWHSGNIINSNNGPIILDWEYAALGDPLVDLACLASGFKLKPEHTSAAANQLGLTINTAKWPLANCLTQLMALSWYGVRQPDKNWQPQQLDWTDRWHNQF